MLRRLSALALAAAFAPFVFFGLVILMALGVASVTMGPIILAFIAWMTLMRWSRRAEDKAREFEILEAKVVRESAPAYPAEAYSPPAHFDLLLSAKHDIGRIRGSAAGIADAAIAGQFRNLAARADSIHARLTAEPVKLGLARRYFASYLPRAADLAEGYHRLVGDDTTRADRRAKLVDVLYRLESAMKEQAEGLDMPDLTRLDIDMKILTQDLADHAPRREPAPILRQVDGIVKGARKS